MKFQSITINLAPANIRHDRMEGRDYIVAPMVMLTEGVHNGTNGPLYYPEAELAKTPVVWNHKPVVVYHPQINGQGVSACDPEIVDKYKIGIVMNTKWDQPAKKLRAEAWIEVERANVVDERIMVAVENGEPMELSTGVFTDNEETEGTWNEEAYTAVARNYRPDHLALLPDIKGACSMADGAGFLVANALAHEDIRQSLSTSIRDRFGSDTWIMDVFEASVVYEHGNKLWKLMYSKTNDVATLAADAPVQVRRNVQYRTVEGALIGNTDYPLSPRSGEADMKKKELVDGLIANDATNWKEEDRDGLMAMNEAQLEKMAPVAIEEPTDNAAAVAAAAAKGAEGVVVPTENAADTGAQPAQNATPPQITLDQLPPEMQAVYNHGLTKLQEERTGLITKITANAANKFTAEQLGAMSLEALQGMAALAGSPTANAAPAAGDQQQAVALFSGAAGGGTATPVANEGHVEKPLGLPTMNFGEEKATA